MRLAVPVDARCAIPAGRVVHTSDHSPYTLSESTQEELREAARRLDLANHQFDDPFARRVHGGGTDPTLKQMRPHDIHLPPGSATEINCAHH